MTHDYKRHGTTTLFAALSILDGQDVGRREDPPHCRLLRHSQASCRASMVEAAPAIPDALHADEFVLAQHGRTILLFEASLIYS